LPFPSALSSGNYDSLRGTASIPPTYVAQQYLVLGSNTTVFAARVNQAVFADSFAQVTYDTVTTGAFADIETGMTVLLARTNDRRAAYFVGRVRKTPTSTLLYINETSVDVDDNDYIFVLRDYRLFQKLGLESSNVYKKDFDLTFAQPGPLIYGLQSAYAGVVSGSPVGYTVSFAPLAIGVTSGATISSWAWTIPAGGVITVGSASTQNITVRFSAAAAEYWVKLIVTDSGGRASTRRFPVWAIPTDLSTTVALGFEGATIDGTIDGGYTATVRAFTGVDTLLDNTLCAVLNIERYNGSEMSIISNIAFTGRIRTEGNRTAADEVYSQLQELNYDIEGVGAQLARVGSPSIYMRDKTSPTVWDEIAALTFWRAMWYLLFHSTFHELHSLTFDDTGTTFRYLQLQTQGGNLFDAVSDFAQSLTATFEFAPQGECRVYRNLNYGTTAQRNAGVTVANFTAQDWLDFSLQHEQVETIGAVGGDGGSFNTTSGKVLALLGNAPKVAQGNAEGTATLSRQVLTANLSKAASKTELSERLGHHYAFANPNDELSVSFPDGYHWLTPSNSQWYTFTIAASENTGGRIYTSSDRWLCQTVSVEHDQATGSKRVQATFRAESEGTPGIAYEPPAPAQIALNLPAIPPIPPFPPLGTPPDIYLPPNPGPGQIPPVITPILYVPKDGNAVLLATANGAWTSRNFLTSSDPDYNEVTPAGLHGDVMHFILDLERGAYLLESDGDNSWVWYTTDVFAVTPTWIEGQLFSGAYTTLALASTAGSVYVYRAAAAPSGAWEEEFNFRTGQQGWSADIDADFSPTNLANYTTNVGWTQQASAGVAFPDNRFTQVVIEISWGTAVTLTAASYDYESLDKGNDADPLGQNPQGIVEADGSQLQASNNLGAGTGTVSWTGSEPTVNSVKLGLDIGFRNDAVACTGVGTIYRARLAGTGVNPFAASSAASRFSSDYGATFGLEVAVGTSPGAYGGFDTIKVGTVVLAAASGQTRIATTPGGAYSSYGSAMPAGSQPSALLVPRLTFTGASNISTSTPVYLVASNALTAGNASLWKVTASGVTFTDITPLIGSDYYQAVSEFCIHIPWRSGSRIAVIGLFNATRHLLTTLSAGTVWSDRGVLTSNARYVRYRKGNVAMNQLYLADGVPSYSPDHGANIYDKTHPDPAGSASAPLLSIEPYG